jgi:hypothetical protein
MIRRREIYFFIISKVIFFTDLFSQRKVASKHVNFYSFL